GCRGADRQQCRPHPKGHRDTAQSRRAAGAVPAVVRGRDPVVHAHLGVEPQMTTAQKSESKGDEERQRLADRVLGRLEDAVYWGIALVLIIGSVSLLLAQFNTMLSLRKQPAKIVMLEVLDGLLLIFIFVELLYAVRACLRSHEIVAEPFLIVGIL